MLFIWARASTGIDPGPGFVVVVVGGGGGNVVCGGCVVGDGFGTALVVGRGIVPNGGFVVDGDGAEEGGDAVVVVSGGPRICARACHMAAAPKHVVAITTIPAARQRALTP